MIRPQDIFILCVFSPFFYLLSAQGEPTATKPFRIAALYSDGSLSPTIRGTAPAATCITRAAIAEARRSGLNVSVEVIDPAWSPVGAAKAAKKVIEDKYDAAVGTILSGEALVAAKILNQAKIPFITPTASLPEVTRGKPFVMRVVFNDSHQALGLARFTEAELKPKTAAIIRNASNPYSNFLAGAYAKELHTRGVRLTDLPVVDGYSDFPELVAHLLSEKPDLIFAPLGESQLASLYVQLVAARARLTLLVSDTIDGDPDFVKLLGPLSPDIPFYFSGYWNGHLEGPHAADYLRLHAKYCNQDPPSRVSATAYDAVNLILEALKLRPSATQSVLISTIRSLEYDGVTGKMRFDQDGDTDKPIEIYSFHNGKAVWWRRYD